MIDHENWILVGIIIGGILFLIWLVLNWLKHPYQEEVFDDSVDQMNEPEQPDTDVFFPLGNPLVYGYLVQKPPQKEIGVQEFPVDLPEEEDV